MISKIITFFYITPIYKLELLIFAGMIIWTIIGYFLYDKKIWTILNSLFFVLSILSIIYMTLCSRIRIDTRDINLVPFALIISAKNAEDLYWARWTIIMNMNLFIPFGISLSNMWRNANSYVVKTILAAFFLSITIELVQTVFCIGRTEIDDVIFNTLGAIIGCFSVLILKMIYGSYKGRKQK